MSEVALFEAKNKLSGLLDRVAVGDEFIITRHGKSAARLAPIQPAFDRATARQAAHMLLQLRKGVMLGDLSIKDLVAEGRL
jgi:prevent-host-death family protein